LHCQSDSYSSAPHQTMKYCKIIASMLVLCLGTMWIISIGNSKPVPTDVLIRPVAEDAASNLEGSVAEAPLAEVRRGVFVTVRKGDSLNSILARHKVGIQERCALGHALSKSYSIRRIHPGLVMEIVLSDELDAKGGRNVEELRFMSEPATLLVLTHEPDGAYSVERRELPHETIVKTVSAIIDSSFYNSARKAGIPRGVATQFYGMLGARVDFQREIKKGDSYSVMFEENNFAPYGDTASGRMLYASLNMQDKSVGNYQYTTKDGYTGFFDENGHSVDTQLLKTPLSHGSLSSLFGRRKHPVYGYMRMHQGVDFAAPIGSSILAAGDGVIDFARRNGGYGNMIRIRHGSRYMTAYAHMSRFAKGMKKGTRVKQGDIIGYVGNTGLSTGPHLHYEVIENGKRINPMTLKLPPSRTLAGDELRRFKEHLKEYAPAGNGMLAKSEDTVR